MKKMGPVFIGGVLLMALAVIGIAQRAGSRQDAQPQPAAAKVEAGKDKAAGVPGQPASEQARVFASGSWDVGGGADGGSLKYAVRPLEQSNQGLAVRLSILDQSGAEIFGQDLGGVSRIYPSYALRKGSPQLVLEVDYGGNAGVLEVLDYQDGKVVDLTDAIKPDNDFGSNAEVRPQFRAGVNAATEPFQILLTQGPLPGSEEKITRVFRFKDGRYRFYGEFSQRKVDDYIEQLMKQPGARNGKR